MQQRLDRLSLQDLPAAALLCVAGHLASLQDRLQLLQTCHRWRELGAGPSQLWCTVSFTASKKRLGRLPRDQRPAAAAEVASGFARWLAPRLPAVESLSFALLSPEPLLPIHRTPVDLLGLLLSPPAAGSSPAPLRLRQLSIQWPGLARLDFASAPPLPHLRRLCFPAGTDLSVGQQPAGQAGAGAEAPPEQQAQGTVGAAQHPTNGGGAAQPGGPPALPAGGPACLPPDLREFELADGGVAAERATWLPPSLTLLCLSAAKLRSLPSVLQHLPRLRSLRLDTNRLGGAPLDMLEQLSSTLEELNLSEAYLLTFPTQVSFLTRLRVLYLHNAFHRTARVAPADWDALRPLGRLAFLSISGNQLGQLPSAVGDLTQLQGLHLEDNDLAGGLPAVPCLAGLRELLLDWQAALDSAPALRTATRLTRLILSGHRAVDLGSGRGLAIRPAAAAEPLLRALGALPALRAVHDVFLGGEDVVTAPVAAVMWQLGRRCPQLQEVGLLPNGNVGLSLADLDGAGQAPPCWRA